MTKDGGSHCHRLRSVVLLCGAMVLAFASNGSLAADLNTPKTGAEVDAPMPAAAAAPAKAPKCYNGCINWGQMCNVDPRGVYKCQRRCEQFGEICE